MTIAITFNGQLTDVDEGSTLKSLIEPHIDDGMRFAVEVNERIVPKAMLTETLLQAGDKVELVMAIGGG